MKREHYSVLGANLTYMIMAFVLMTAGAYFQARSFVSGIFITEYILVLAPVLVLGVIRKINLKKALRLNPLSFKQMGIIIAIAFALLPTVALANTITIYFLSLIDKVLIPPIPTASNLSELGLYMFLISISAGICEEFFFRGMMLDAFESRFNRKWGVIVSAVLFGVFHFNMQNLLGPIVLGLVFGYIVQLTNSIWAGVLAHATNNGIAVILGYLANRGANSELVAEAQVQQLNNSTQLLMTIGFLVVIAGGLWVLILSLLKALRNDLNVYSENSKFSIRGVDYLVLSQYNSSVAAVRIDAIGNDNAVDEVKNIEVSKLKKLNPQSLAKLWDDPIKNNPQWYQFVPWIGVLIIYIWYINMHLTYVG